MGTRGRRILLATSVAALVAGPAACVSGVAPANLARIVTGSPISWTKGASRDVRNMGEGG
ncbi:hypothetical protein [Nonomuraea sp. NPDC049607]|uniref:hypothetical protein n=1 Tax=Nonomuraea sp. NPDC049607 TaxID=3154732 RepID=UPI003432649E